MNHAVSRFGFLGCLASLAALGSARAQDWLPMQSGSASELRAFWAPPTGDVYAVANHIGCENLGHCYDVGDVLRFDGSTWTLATSNTYSELYAIWGWAPSQAIAVGRARAGNTLILRGNGSAWTAEITGLSGALHGVWGTSPTNIIAVGEDGRILHYNGTAWLTQDSGTSNDLFAVWGSSARDVFAVGGRTILHFDGAAWSTMAWPGGDHALEAVWGAASNHVWAAGATSAILHYDGTAWSVETAGAYPVTFGGLWGSSATDVYAVGYSSTGGPSVVLHQDGSGWTPIDVGTTAPLRTIGGRAAHDVFIGGDGGTILHGAGPKPAWRQGEVTLGGDWRWLSWFGYYHLTFPWAFHLQHGFLYPVDDAQGGVYFYDAAMHAFWWSDAVTYPFVYRFGPTPTWLYYAPGTQTPRWFYAFTPGQWQSLP